MDETPSEEEEELSFIQRAASKALAPVYLATSRPAVKAYLSTFLFLSVSLILLSISTTAYALFYYYYIPQIDLSRVIHLQYADGPFPHATTYLTSPTALTPSSSLASLQPYDVVINLHLPRTPTNLAAGNFMLDLSLFPPPLTSDELLPSIFNTGNNTTPIAHSRRPAILHYRSPITSLTSTVMSLPLHVLSLRDVDSTILSVPMFEKVTFSRGWRNLPTLAKLEIQSQSHTQATLLGQPASGHPHVPLQVYSASIDFHARFQGLRWIMYNFRVLSFLVFTGAFYCTALVSTGIVWGVVAVGSPLLASSSSSSSSSSWKKQDQAKPIKPEEGSENKDTSSERKTIKREPQDQTDQCGQGKSEQDVKGEVDDDDNDSALSLSNISESATTFPTLRGQMPIRFPFTTRDSRQDEGEPENDVINGVLSPMPTTAGEFAEDEDKGQGQDEDDMRGRRWSRRNRDQDRDRDADSGLGTSMEESAREWGAGQAAGLQRRRSGRS